MSPKWITCKAEAESNKQTDVRILVEIWFMLMDPITSKLVLSKTVMQYSNLQTILICYLDDIKLDISIINICWLSLT